MCSDSSMCITKKRLRKQLYFHSKVWVLSYSVLLVSLFIHIQTIHHLDLNLSHFPFLSQGDTVFICYKVDGQARSGGVLRKNFNHTYFSDHASPSDYRASCPFQEEKSFSKKLILFNFRIILRKLTFIF